MHNDGTPQTVKLAYLGEAENIVDEEKHILPFSIAEVLSNSKPSETNTSTSTRGLIHLTIDKSTLAVSLISTQNTTM